MNKGSPSPSPTSTMSSSSMMVPPANPNTTYSVGQLCRDTDELAADIHNLLVNNGLPLSLFSKFCSWFLSIGKSHGFES